VCQNCSVLLPFAATLTPTAAANDEVVMRSLPTQVLEKQSEMLNGVRQGKEKCHHGREEHVVVRSARSFAEKSTVT
jgi:hypothetical protein